jgi:hypothetical protein
MSARKPIELDVHLELRDFLRANYWFLFKRFKLLFILLVLGGIVYPVFYALSDKPKDPTGSYWGLLIPFGILALLFGNTYFGAKRQMTSNKGLSEPIHYTFSEDGIAAVADSSSGQGSWSNIHEAYETKHNFLLFISKNMMYTIPKRCFLNEEQISSFKELLKLILSSKAKLK